MAKRVFADDAARRRLEGVIHPLVFEEIQKLEAAAPPDAIVAHDIPLLAESGRADTFDAVVVVDAPGETQVERMLRERDWTREEAGSRTGAQASRDQPLATAASVTDKGGDLDDLRRQVEEVYGELAARTSR